MVCVNVKDYASGLDEEYNSIKGRYYQTVARNLFLNEEFFRIFNVFSKRSISLIPLKGIALIQNIYSDIGARFVGDIDILIKAQDVSKAINLLRELGYSSLPPYFNPKRPYSIYLNSVPLSKPTEIAYFIHLHWHILNTTFPNFIFRINMEEIWQAAKSEKYQGKEIIMLTPEHQLVYLSVHAFNHAFNKMSLLIDMQKVIEFYKDRLDWQKVIETAKHWNATLPLYYSVYFTSKILKVNFLADFLDILKAKKMSKADERIIFSISETKLGSHNLVYLLYLNMSGNILQKLKFILLSLFPPPRVLAQIYSVNCKYLVFLYYFKRFAWGLKMLGDIP